MNASNMKWNFFSFEIMFKRIFRYLLRRFFGQYLEDFSQDELSYGFSCGKMSLENVHLNCEALNGLSEEYNLPVEFLHGSIDFVSIMVPWSSLLADNTVIELRGLSIIVRPKERPEDVSMFYSMWGSMTSSLQLAEECLKSKTEEDVEEDFDANAPAETLQKIAHTIDAVFANMKVKFLNSSLKIEHILQNENSGVVLEFKIANVEYFDEAGVNVPSNKNVHCNPERNVYEPQAYTVKKVLFEGISVYTAEFSPKERVFPISKQELNTNYMGPSSFVPGSPEMPPTHSSYPVKKTTEHQVLPEPVLISKLAGKQELRLRIKQNEAVIGPNVDAEFNFGAVNLLLSPQQVHMLLELFHGLMKTVSHGESSKNVPLYVPNKPMRPADYALVEKELLRQQEKPLLPSKSLQNQQGWSSHSFDASEQKFHLMTMENRVPVEVIANVDDLESSCTSINSDARSDYTDIKSESTKGSKARESTVNAMLRDHVSELTHFRGCCSSICIIILHDDSVQESLNTHETTISVTSLSKSLTLKERAEKYFEDLLSLQMSGFDFKNFKEARNPLSALCETSHLRLMASSLALDGNEKSSSLQRILHFELSVYQLEILECLFNSTALNQQPTYSEILSFEKTFSSSKGGEEIINKSCFRLKYHQYENTSQQRVYIHLPNKLDIQFGQISTEVDISLTDRIRTLLDVPLFATAMKCDDVQWRCSDIGTITRISPTTEISISSPSLSIYLRFPIPDLRSIHDMDRVPWWQQNLRKEIFVMEMKDFTLTTTVEDEISKAKFKIQCRDFHGGLKMSPSEEPISFLRVSVDPDLDEVSRNGGFDWPHLIIHKLCKVTSTVLEARTDDNEEQFSCSISAALMSELESEPSPFSSSSVVYGSKLQNSDPSEDDVNDHDEVIKPADRQTILDFIEHILSKSEYVLEFILPTVNLALHDKDFFELICNRLNDLLLWQNASLSPSTNYDLKGFKDHAAGLEYAAHVHPIFQPFQSFKTFSNDSNSDSDSDETNFCSVYEYFNRQRQKKKKKHQPNGLTKLSFSVSIAKGLLSFQAPLTENDTSSKYCGDFQLYVEEGTLFLATTYLGDRNSSYVCFLAEKSTLYHEGLVCQSQKEKLSVQSLSSLIKKNLKCIISQSGRGMHLKETLEGNNAKNMNVLRLAIHILFNPKQQLKTFKVALDICGSTLRHYMSPLPESWIKQFMNFMKVKYESISGYIRPSIVTELHINLNNCAVDYRPLYIPLRAAITVENFNMSCNVTATTPSFLFRIISEEMRLFISRNVKAKKLNLKQNYICIADSGLIELLFKTSINEQDELKVETCASNNRLHIRTCADSFRALADLMIYLSNNGDLSSDDWEQENQKVSGTVEQKTSESPVSEDNDLEKLHLLMAEAMKESNGDDDTKVDARVDMESDISNTDDEFCILEDEPGVGLMPQNGEPQIKLLTENPIRIIENHFSIPPGKPDAFKAPRNFPNPIIRVALREMNLVWYLYGGSDFKVNEGKTKKSVHIRKNEVAYETENNLLSLEDKNVDSDKENVISFCKVTPLTKQFDIHAVHFSLENVTVDRTKVSSNVDSWVYEGGTYRNHDILMELQLNKLRFQREIYPNESEYASRYILLIHDIEIRDRLASSQINKFLYQYSSKMMPRQSHANMIEVKATYTRPASNPSNEECTLKVSCKPIRLNIDQDALMFLIEFFQVVDVQSEDNVSDTDEYDKSDLNMTPQMSELDGVRKLPNLTKQSSPNDTTFYRFFSFSPDVLIRLDYHGKRVAMKQGALQGLLLGLAELNCSEIKLKRLCYRHGLLGHHKVFAYATNEWQQDIVKNQLPSLLCGMGPLHSISLFFQGVRDFFYLPMEQYQKDGQIIRGLKRGTFSFSTSAVMAFIDVSSTVVRVFQGIAEVAYDMVSPGPSVARNLRRSLSSSRRPNQPADIMEGVATAYTVFKEGMGDTARTIYQVASSEHEHKGVPGAVGGVLRQIPPTIVKPIILSSEATHIVLGGFKHQLVPDAHQEDIDKWKSKNH